MGKLQDAGQGAKKAVSDNIKSQFANSRIGQSAMSSFEAGKNADKMDPMTNFLGTAGLIAIGLIVVFLIWGFATH